MPRDAAERAELFGLLFLLCGEEGFGWQRRLMMFHQVLALPETVLPATHPARQMVARLGRRYGYRPEAAEAAPGRCAEILRLLGARLEAQRTRGRTTLLGNALTALDIYWAAFAAMIEPLPQAQCPMPDAMRAQYTVADGPLREAAAAGLLEHRDRIYREHIGLPVDL